MKFMWHFLNKIQWNMHEYWSNLTQSRQYTSVGLSSMQWINQYAHNLKHDGIRQIKKSHFIDQSITITYWYNWQFITLRRVVRFQVWYFFPTKKCISKMKKMINIRLYVRIHKNQVNPNKLIFVRVGGISWTFFARYPKFQALNADYTWISSINVHPSQNVMADFFQTEKLWPPHQICMILVGA